MNRSHQQSSFAIILFLLLIGATGVALAFWLADHHQVVSDSGVIIAILLGVFFVSYTWALLLYLRWRDRRRSVLIRPIQPTALSQPDLEGTIYGVVPGSQYRVMKSFTDFYGNSFEQGKLLRFKERHFLPYDGGHTVVFEERSLYLQEDINREILENFSEYIVQIKQ